MKKLTVNEEGFIPLLLSIITIVLVLIYLAYTRVLHAVN
jgi:hypothetical protein